LVGFGLAVFIYADDRHPSGWSTLRQKEAAVKLQRRDAEYYTGSTIIFSASGENRWQYMIDNRTGKNVGQGYVNCYEAVSPQEKNQRVGMSVLRMNAIGKAFNRGGQLTLKHSALVS
jgi:hypothetical protein